MTTAAERAFKEFCPVTLPLPLEIVPKEAAAPILGGSGDPYRGHNLPMHGNDALWVTVPRDGIIESVHASGAVSERFMTVELKPAPFGILTADATRLDGDSPPAEIGIASGWTSGGSLYLVGVSFPTAGCWMITHRIQDKELRFVVKVVPHPWPDEDAVLLKNLADRAAKFASTSIPVPLLRHVESDGGSFRFLFTDSEAKAAVTVVVPRPDSPEGEWRIINEERTPLLGSPHSGIDIAALRIGPEAVKRAAKGHWENCQILGLSLPGSRGDLSWNVYCRLPEGDVAASVDGKTGNFTARGGAPGPPPPTANQVVLAGGCPVTIANGYAPPGETRMHGGEELTTVLWPDGKVVFQPEGPGFIDRDGSLSMKWPWTRGDGIVGSLTIEGRRLDAAAPPLRANIPEGYGNTGFQSTALIFPSEGCWEVTGRAGDASLTFVTLVVKVGEGPR